MNKKFVWKRVNRGFLVSMVLLAGVLVYVLVTQLMLIPEKQALRELADSVRRISDADQIWKDEDLTRLQGSEEEQKKELERLNKELEPLFIKDTSYLSSVAKSFLGDILGQAEGERLTALTFNDGSAKTESCTIQGDTAIIAMTYSHTVSGYFIDYNDVSSGDGDIQLKKAENVQQSFYLSLTCKKEDGQWKIFRVSNYGRGRDRNMEFSTEVVHG